MRIRTLGGLSLEGAAFTRPKPLLLLAFLAVEGAQPRRHVAELFWPDARDRMKSLTVALTQLRRGAPGSVEADGRRVWTPLPCDAVELRGLIERGRREEAAARYGGPFLHGFETMRLGVELEEWLYATREAIAVRVQRTLLDLALDDSARARFRRAARRAEPAVGLAPGAAEPEDLARLHTVLLAGRSPLAAAVRVEAEEYGQTLVASTDEARSRLRAQAPDDVPLPAVDLPRYRTAFVGRRRELDEIRTAVTRSGCRLLTLVGPAGVGKSRLALQAALGLGRTGAIPTVRCARLGEAPSVAEVPAALIAALGLGAAERGVGLDAAAAAIGRRRLLLVCDGVEHLVDGSGMFGHLLDRCPNLTLLATSRERLHLDGERLFPVDGLAYPSDPDVGLDAALRFDAIRLFLRRARGVRPDFALCPDDLPHLVRVCRGVDGHPLGLELAAAWVRVLPLPAIADAVLRDLDLLGVTTRDVPERHRSVRAAFERSWRALEASECRLLVRLAVLRNGFGLEAAAAVAGATLPALASLVDKSWLRLDGDGRYTRHPLIHHFTRSKLHDAPAEAADAVRRHARFFLGRGRAARDLLLGGHRRAAIEALEAVGEDVAAALDALDPDADPASFRAAVDALTAYYETGSRCEEGLALMARLRARDEGAGLGGPAVRRRLVAAEARLCRCRGGEARAPGDRRRGVGARVA
jgi:predicted ATPase